MMPSKKLCDKDYIERSYILRIERLPQLRELPRKKFRSLNIRNHEVYIQAFVQHCIESRHSSCCTLIPDTFNMVVRYTENPSSDPLLSLMFSLSWFQSLDALKRILMKSIVYSARLHICPILYIHSQVWLTIV